MTREDKLAAHDLGVGLFPLSVSKVYQYPELDNVEFPCRFSFNAVRSSQHKI